MNIVQLRDRLNANIAEHDTRGWNERNALPVYVEVKDGRALSFVPVNFFASSMMSFAGPEGQIHCLHASASGSIKLRGPGSRKGKK